MEIFEAEYHFRIRAEVRPSQVAGAGLGVYALEEVAAGEFVGMDFPAPRRLATHAEVRAQPPELRKYSWRHVEHVYFAARDDLRTATDFLNHSFDPNILWHLGCYFTARDVAVGDELTVDYRVILAPGWQPDLVDGHSRRPIEPLPWREAVIQSGEQLVALMRRARRSPED
jgi:uncharacterized protein